VGAEGAGECRARLGVGERVAGRRGALVHVLPQNRRYSKTTFLVATIIPPTVTVRGLIGCDWFFAGQSVSFGAKALALVVFVVASSPRRRDRSQIVFRRRRRRSRFVVVAAIVVASSASSWPRRRRGLVGVVASSASSRRRRFVVAVVGIGRRRCRRLASPRLVSSRLLLSHLGSTLLVS
jgi:hypothetical protein